jgi:hypothetical protein
MNDKIKICEQYIFDPNTNASNLKTSVKTAKKIQTQLAKKKDSQKQNPKKKLKTKSK